MEYLFGPVPSRRLGQSLGVDVIPFKKCNWNCVYCQLGRTEKLTCQREEYVKAEDVLFELDNYFKEPANKMPDWITFVGSGEPTLNSSIGKLISEIKNLTDIPVAVITNGSLLYMEEIQEELNKADALLPSLDAGNDHLFRRLNRSHPKIKFEEYIQGLVSCKKNFTGKFWVELMLLNQFNTSFEQMNELAEIIKEINPDEVHISLPTRPPAETWVQKADPLELSMAQNIIGKYAHVLLPVAGAFELPENEDFETSIYNIVSRHPLHHQQLMEILKIFPPEEVEQELINLEKSEKVKKIIRFGEVFWRAAEAKYSQDE